MKIEFRWPVYYPKPSRSALMRVALDSAESAIKHDDAGHARGLACPGCYTESLIRLAQEEA